MRSIVWACAAPGAGIGEWPWPRSGLVGVRRSFFDGHVLMGVEAVDALEAGRLTQG